MRGVALSLACLLLAGCLEAEAPPESSGPAVTPPSNVTNTTQTSDARGGATSPEDPAFALRLWTPCFDCQDQNVTARPPTLDLFLASGRALRAELAAGDADAFLAGKDGPSAALVLQTLAELGKRDLVPTRITTVDLPAALAARLRGAVEEAWSLPQAFLDQPCERQCPTVFGRSSPNATGAGWEILEVRATPDLDDPRNEPLRELYSAFFAAGHALENGAPPTAEPTPHAVSSTPPTRTTANMTVPASPPPRTEPSIVDWQGQDSEFGSIRAPFQVEVGNGGTRAPIEARITLHTKYEELDARFFMFRFDVENTPLDVAFDHLVRMDTGAELPCYQRQGSPTTAISCFVDLKEMPPAGTEVRMIGTVGSSRDGTFQVGSIVIPFSYTWARITMSNGLFAELYAGTQVVADGAAPPGTSP